MQKNDLTRSDLRSFSRASRIRVLDASEWQAEDQVTVTVDADVTTNMLFTTHSLPISFLLKELKSRRGSVVFLGIQPAQLEFMSPLTPAVREAVEKIYGMLKAGSELSAKAGLPFGPRTIVRSRRAYSGGNSASRAHRPPRL